VQVRMPAYRVSAARVLDKCYQMRATGWSPAPRRSLYAESCQVQRARSGIRPNRLSRW
jgi:hypothetical protein